MLSSESGKSMSSRLLKLKQIALGQAKLWLFAVLVTICMYLWLDESNFFAEFIIANDDSRRNFGILIAQLSGAFAAFLLTSIALVFTLPDRPLLSEMRHSGHFLELCATLASAIAGCGIVLLLSVCLAAAAAPSTWITLLISTFPALAMLLFQAALRFFLTMVAMALPS